MDCLLLFCLFFILSTSTSFTHCEARKTLKHRKVSKHKVVFKHLDTYYSNYFMGSPSYQDPMGPSSSPTNDPPFCIYPPLTPLPPSTTLPTPIQPIQFSPPPPSSPPLATTPPFLTPYPPEFPAPSPPESQPNPPTYEPSPPEYVPGPPEYVPGPPGFIPSPPEFVPGPVIFLPPVVYPPPTLPPPPPAVAYGGTGKPLWCVAKPTVPDPIIQEAMNYACGSGADCNSIQPSGPCYQPDTLIAHASFAFNSYWQRTKVAGGTCDFGGTAMLITKDPSNDGCHFPLN